ncbi:MAG TPA: EAL domain-containing protein [Thiobacillus sp.]|nr:EAL domain-containing protein [Thiobacillus sp.]
MSRATFYRPWKSPLARRLTVAIVLFSASIILVMTAVQIYQEYRRDLDGVEAQFRQIGEVHLPTLTQSLWATNDKEIRLQLEGMLRLPNIVYAAVHEKDRLHTQVGQRDAGRMIERRYVMYYEHLGQSREIGTLTVVATLEDIYVQLMREAIQVLLSNALRTLLVALFIFVLFHRLITRHLAAVADHLRNTDPAAPVAPLALARAPTSTPDELDVLVASTNDMQTKTLATLNALRDSEARVRLLLDSTSEAIYGVDTQGICTFANPACVRMLGYASEDDLIGRRIHDQIHHTHPDGRPYPLEDCAVRVATLAGQACHRNDEVHWRADGSSFPVEFWSHPMYQSGMLVGSVVAFIDISEYKQTEAELHRLAYFDSLTGLPNRILFNDRLHQALTDARRRSRLVALMLLDIDRFKIVNDTLGHEAGDCLLREIATRLQHSIRGGDTVSRLGGDEFALVFADVADIQHVAQLAQKVLSQFTAPVAIDGREVFTGASIGIALYPADTEDADSLLKFADSAMYHAKESGRNNYQFYSHEMTASVQARLRMETDLRRALDNHEFFLHYQPQVDARSDRITGVEALLRWRDPAGNLISPMQFIPLAEDTGLIVPIGKWVLETACTQLKRWRDAGHVELTLSVNVASRQFRDPMFPDTVSKAIASSGIPPQALELEITESILLEHCDETLRTLNDLKRLGVTLAIDDFGTGYSSLSYLKRFPIDRVKIDQSFVRDLATDNDDLAIVRAIIALARALRLSVIAEGVETAEQLALLRHEDCHEYQGYFFAHPMDADSIDGRLQPSRAASVP